VEILQNAAGQGKYSLLSVLHGRNLDGFVQFRDDPTWLPSHKQHWEYSRAIIVVMNLDNEEDHADLSKLVNVFRSSDSQVPIIAVHFALATESTSLIQQKHRQVVHVLSTGVDFVKIDPGFFDTVEVALIKNDIQNGEKNELLERLTQANDELAAAKDHLEYLFWQWVPHQLRLTEFVPPIDEDLEERDDGSIGHLQFIRGLGQGAFGEVHEARDPSGQTVAVKVMRKDNVPTIQKAQRIYREIQILATIPRHDHLASLHDVLHSIDTVYICLSYGGPQNLLHFQMRQPNRTFSLDNAQEVFGQIAGAVGHMHAHEFFHRDIKPENIAVSTMSSDSASVDGAGIKTMLVDCGLSVSGHKPLQQQCGSLPFAAPEILDEPCSYFGGPADSFAVGMVLFELVRGQMAMERVLGWDRNTAPVPARATELRNLPSRGPPDINQRPTEPLAVRQLLSGLLQIDPPRRMNLEEVLMSSWLRSVSFEQSMPPMSQ